MDLHCAQHGQETSGKQNFPHQGKETRIAGKHAMVVATETEVGGVTAVVGGMYDGHFGRVRGYTKHSIKLTLLHELARPWAKVTANVKVTIRKPSVRLLNSNEIGRIASWEGNAMEIEERQQRRPSGNASSGRGIEAELLAGLVALHICAHPEGVSEGRLSFQEELDGIMRGKDRAQ
jgi:hypothetical protein